MPSSLTRAAAVVLIAVAACSDSSDDGLAEWCDLQERGLSLMLAVDFDAFNAGDPEALAAAAEAEEALVAVRESEPPEEIRETFELAIDPGGFQPNAPPESAAARDEWTAYVVENCDFPSDLEEQLQAQ
jgi:hypothetical protein